MADLETLRRAYARTDAEDDGGHLSESCWERLACGELEAEEKRRALDHVLGCARCAEIYRAVSIIAEEVPAFDPEAPVGHLTAAPHVDSRRFGWRAMGFLALAAVVVVGVALPLIVNRGPAPGPGLVVRSADDSPRIVPVEPVSEVISRPGEDVVFSWQVIGSDTAVVVGILDADGEPVWTSTPTIESSATWPADRVPGPGRYYWRVLPSGPSDTAASELVAFDLVIASPP